MVEYFVMYCDDRVLSPLKLSLSAAEIDSEEPFVTYTSINTNTNLVDFFYTRKIFKYCFCVSDELKELLEVYADNMTAVPFFITDKDRGKQLTYWKIGIEIQDCLEVTPQMKYDNLTIIKDKIKSKYIFRVMFEKQEYIIVSLHLAENILRKNMCRIKFIPISLK